MNISFNGETSNELTLEEQRLEPSWLLQQQSELGSNLRVSVGFEVP